MKEDSMSDLGKGLAMYLLIFLNKSQLNKNDYAHENRVKRPVNKIVYTTTRFSNWGCCFLYVIGFSSQWDLFTSFWLLDCTEVPFTSC